MMVEVLMMHASLPERKNGEAEGLMRIVTLVMEVVFHSPSAERHHHSMKSNLQREHTE